MKINPIKPNNIVQPYRTSKPVGTTRPGVQQKSDEVMFSEKANSFSKILAEVKEQLSAQTPEDTARIANIASRVHAGTYSVDSNKVAEKMISRILFE